MARPWRGTDTALAAAAGLAGLATRWALRGHALFSWDSGLLASGVVEYDFAAGQPHPPYYPLAIALMKVLAWVQGPVDAVVCAAVLGACAMAAFTCLVGAAVAGRWAGAAAAAIVVLSPTALSNGIAPLTYSLEGAASAVLAWCAWRCRSAPSPSRVAVLAVATSVAVGIRPSSAFVLAPVAAWAVWGRWTQWPRALAWGAGATLAWLVPAVVAGGGLGWFLRGSAYQSRTVVFAHTVFQEGIGVVPRYAARLASDAPWELPFAAAVAALAAVTAFVWWPHRPRTPVASFLAAWMAPSMLFYLFVYDGWPVYPSGYVLAVLPAAAVACAVALRAVALGFARSGAPGPARAGGLALCALLLAVPASWAAHWPEATAGQREADRWAAELPSLREAYPPNSTAILTYYGWYWVKFGLPEYLAWGAQPYLRDDGAVMVQVAQRQGSAEGPPQYANSLDGPDDPLHPIPSWVQTVVIVQAPPSRGETWMLKPGLSPERRTLPSGLVVDAVPARDLPPTIEQAMPWFDGDGHPIPRFPDA